MIQYLGSKYHCPFCQRTSGKLKPYGFDFQVLYDKHVVGGGRRNSGCPHCYSSDRERLIYLYLRHHTSLWDSASGKTLLHVAPEKHLSEVLLRLKHVNYVCGDKLEPGYTYPSHVKHMDILAIDYPDASFDFVICNHVLEHINDDHKAMSELFRVLKPGGQAILQVPFSLDLGQTDEDFSVTDPKAREMRFGQFDHVRLYGADYISRLTNAGFRVEKVGIARNPEYQKYGLNPDEDIFVGHKD
jgi:SAM-dependent methyltransferase